MPPEQDAHVTDHLANERTFLAWFRTGLTLVALGVAASQFLSPDVVTGVPLVRLIATVLVGTGAGLVAIGMARYRSNRRRIDERAFQPAGASVTLAVAAAVFTAILAIAFVWLLPGQ